MPQGLYIDAPQHVVLRAYDDPPLGDEDVHIRATFAAIKHGTIFHLFSGDSPFHGRHFDHNQRLFVQNDSDAPNEGFSQRFVGDSVVGTVTAVGPQVTRFQPGDRVYCYGGMCETLTKRQSDLYPLPAMMSEADAVCMDPAFFAASAVRDARVSIGDHVVVFGLGAIGLLVTQLLARTGALSVIGVDLIEKRRALAEQFGATATIDPSAGDVALEVRRLVGPAAADVAIEASGNYRALSDALRVVGQCARVVTLGYYKGRDTVLELGAEWHHNRLELIGSMPVWQNPMREYPRWDEARMRRTLETMFAQGQLRSAPITDPVVDLQSLPEAFLSIYHDPHDAIKLSVRFNNEGQA